MVDLDEFTKSYLEAALWSSTDDNEDPLDKHHGIQDIAESALEQSKKDCETFQKENAADLATWAGKQYTAEEMGGHDFWLTRNGHGAGFWDGDWPKDAGKRLTEASKKFGEVDLFVNDNGKIEIL